MATFAYTAKDKKGSMVEGTMDADGRGAVVSRLQQMGYFPVKIAAGSAAAKAAPVPSPRVSSARVAKAAVSTVKARVSKAAAKKPAPAVAAKPKTGEQSATGFFRKNKIGSPDVAGFNRQLADLIGAGIPLVKALAILQKQTANENLKVVITKILNDVQGGDTFADALRDHPAVFSKMFVAMVKSGEAGGILDEVLNRLADMSEADEQIKGKIKSALAYPTVMIIAGSGAVTVMFTYVIPKITATFTQTGQALPGLTQALITMSSWAQSYWYLFLLAIVVGGFSIHKFASTAEGKLMWHRLQLKLPIMGPVVQKREVARFTRTLGSLLANGVSILGALDITREVLNNTVFKMEVTNAIEEITQGASVAQPLADSPVFPPVAVNMIAIGEETGRLPEVLLRIGDSFETQVDRQVRTLTALIEPIIIVIMGLVVGFIVIAMLLPIFSMDPSGGR